MSTVKVINAKSEFGHIPKKLSNLFERKEISRTLNFESFSELEYLRHSLLNVCRDALCFKEELAQEKENNDVRDVIDLVIKLGSLEEWETVDDIREGKVEFEFKNLKPV